PCSTLFPYTTFFRSGQQALISRMVEESGECFIRLRYRRPEDDLVVPLQLQVLPPEFVPIERNFRTRSGNAVRAGIEFNSIGQRVAYWMYKENPGERQTMRTGYNEPHRIAADQVRHISDTV